MKKKLRLNNLDYFIWGIIFFWLIIDSITGFFASKGTTIPLSQLVKSTLLVLIALRLSSNYKSSIYISIIIIYLGVYLIHTAINNYIFANAFLSLTKFLSLVFSFLYFRFFVRKFPDTYLVYFNKAIFLGGITILANMIVGVLGFGSSTYGIEEGGTGIKGFFFAGNELGGIMAVMAPIFYYYAYNELTGAKRVFTILIVTFTGFLIATKTSIFVTLLSCIIIPLIYYKEKRAKIILMCIISLGFLFYIGYIYLDSLNIGIIDRWSYFYENGGLNRLIFSGRDEFWDYQKEIFFKSDVCSQIFGIGSIGKLIERDHLDSLLMYGYIGYFLVLSFFIGLIFNALKYRKNNNLVGTIILSDILVITIGYLAGHVWYSAMASIYISLINSFVYLRTSSSQLIKMPRNLILYK